jgi:N-acetylneuraminic acid mutarotase
MKMFRPALAGILPAFVLLVGIQLNARAACTAPPPDMQSWFTGDDTVSHHIWQPVVTPYNGATSATAKVAAPSQSRQLLFEDRVAYQRAVEEVYWRHRIWPKERPDPKSSLDAVMSQATIEEKVQNYLRHSELLEEEWQKPITPEQLQAEMERMAQHTKQPAVLRELFAALGNDPFVIAECLARPVLLERLQLAAVESRKGPLDFSRAKEAQGQLPNEMAAANTNYAVPAISDQPSECIDDWAATSTTHAPAAGGRAVWTGTEMIVWGGGTGGRYNPVTDSWTAISATNAPTPRGGHTAVWTGSEMIVWGGSGNTAAVNTGGRYNPSTDSWTATSTTNAPTRRYGHTAVWSGGEMIVWGGLNSNFQPLETGGRYNPDTDSWAATTRTNAPTARQQFTAVWTGSEMIVWGGYGPGGRFEWLDTGGRYDPGTDSWTATSTTNAPTARQAHTAVLAESEMIVWGGFNNGSYLNTGGRYDPSTDSWTAMSTTNAPLGRVGHTSVSTDSEMIVWGGYDGSMYLKSGGRYGPSTDGWTATSRTNAPTNRQAHTAVWTGSEMIVWGGIDENFVSLNTGGRYCAQAGPPTITLNAEARKVNEVNTVRLIWSGATSTDIDVYRCTEQMSDCDLVLIATTPNNGSYDDSTGDTGRASYEYRVCEAGTLRCSDVARVRFKQ